MSEKNNSEFKDVPLAKLEDGEALIPHPLIEQYNDYVKDLKDKHVEVSEEAVNVISSDKSATSPNLSVTSNEENVIGSASADKKETVKPTAAKNKDMVAIHSTKNVSWSGVGSVSRGYNIVTKEASVKWLTRYHIRLATPEEVARDFGK
jgi:predicted RNA-binding protein with RPS1 domain